MRCAFGRESLARALAELIVDTSSRSSGGLGDVSKARHVATGDVVTTTGWADTTTGLRSIYPRGIAIGNVTSSAATDTDLYREIQVTPSADLQSFSTVTVFTHAGAP